MSNNYYLEVISGLLGAVAYISKAFLPLLMGLFIAYIFNGPVEYVCHFLSQHSSISLESSRNRCIGIFLTYIIAFIAIFSLGYAFIFLMLGALPSGDLKSIANSLYSYFMSLEVFSNWFEKFFSAEKLVDLASSLVTGFVNLFLGVVASVYLLKDKEKFLLLWQKLLSLFFKQKTHGLINEILHEINMITATFVKGAMFDSVLVAILSSVVLSVLNVKYGAVIGIIGGILNVIPYFGPFLGMAPSFLVALANQGLSKAILSVIALFVVQQIDSNYIYPKVVGTTTGIHPLYILLSVSVMGYLGGILGMLVAVPIAGICQVLITKWAYSK